MGRRNPPDMKKIHFPPFFDKKGNHKYHDRKSARASKTTKARKELQGPKKIHFPCFFEENRRAKEKNRNQNAAKEKENYNKITQFFMARLAAQEFKAFLAIENEMKEEKKREKEKKMKKESKAERDQKNEGIREEDPKEINTKNDEIIEFQKADDTKTSGCFGFIRRWFSKSKKKKKSVRFSDSVMTKIYDPRSTIDNAHQIQVNVNDVDIRLF